MFEKASLEAREADNSLYAIAFCLGLALFWICLKSFSFSIALLSIAAATFGATLGTYGWLGIPLNQISALGPLVVVVVAIADGIHILAAYVQGLHQGLAKLDSMAKSLEINLRPITLATITTAMGFLSQTTHHLQASTDLAILVPRRLLGLRDICLLVTFFDSRTVLKQYLVLLGQSSLSK